MAATPKKGINWQAVACALILGFSIPQISKADEFIRFDIASQPLASALQAFAAQSKMQLLYEQDAVRNAVANAVVGNYEKRDALQKLLHGTELEIVFSADNAATIRVKSNASANAETPAGSESRIRLAQATPPAKREGQDGINRVERATDKAQVDPSATSSEVTEMDAVVVTGSHIRGAQFNASPVLVFDREDIAQSGYSNTQQFIQGLAQNFGGGTSESTMGGYLGGEGSSDNNYTRASGANLRGLGNSATLTLLNGRRVAPVGVGQAVDLSAIPLAAVERIDVLTDGASAIYGSDAIGGVINIVLLDSYEGAETSLRYGNVTSGSHAEYKIGQTFGRSWDSGNALVSYEYAKRDPLSSLDRKFARQGSPIGDIVPPSEQHSAIIAVSQDATDRVSLFGQALLSARDSETRYTSASFDRRAPVETDQYSVALGALIDMGSAWYANVDVGYSENEMAYSVSQDGVRSYSVDMKADVLSAEVKADGAIFDTPGGKAMLAVGAQYRRESMNSTGDIRNTGGADERDVSALFSEMLIPFFGPGNARPGMRRLELSIASRHEKYTDAGSTTNPKFGLVWSPVASLNLRGTYGTSFRAPSLYESNVNAQPLAPQAYLLPDAESPSGATAALLLFGTRSDLKPEKATTWTVGFDFTPESLPGATLSVTYYSIDFEDRIGQPLIGAGLAAALTKEAEHPDFITRDPDVALVAEYFANPQFLNFTGLLLAPEDIGAIADNRTTNVASVAQSGLDLNLAYDMPTGIGDFGFQINGAYLFKKDIRVTPQAPVTSGLNTVFNPVDLRMRGKVSWTRNDIGAALFLNYVDSYRNPDFGNRLKVDSWTTMDLSVSYHIANRESWLGGTTLSLSALNVLDEPPPFIDYFGLNFDATNASGVGRYISLKVVKAW